MCILTVILKDDDDCTGTMKALPDDGTLVPSNDLPDTGTLTSAMLDLGTMVINSDTDSEATMKSTFSYKIFLRISYFSFS